VAARFETPSVLAIRFLPINTPINRSDSHSPSIDSFLYGSVELVGTRALVVRRTAGGNELELVGPARFDLGGHRTLVLASRRIALPAVAIVPAKMTAGLPFWVAFQVN